MYILEVADFSVQSHTGGQAEGWPNIYGKHSRKCPCHFIHSTNVYWAPMLCEYRHEQKQWSQSLKEAAK